MERTAVLFDLDGTLWDSSLEVLRCWNEILAPLGRQITEKELARLMGLTPREIGDVQFPDLFPQERYALTNRCLDAEAPYLFERGARLYPRVRETLLALRQRHFVGLVSNCTEDYALAFLHAHGLSALFDDHETAGHTGLDKGQNIRLLIDRNQIKKAVYIGDTAMDLAAAQAAQIPFLFVRWGFGSVDEGYPSADSFSSLTEAVSSLLEG